ncbi:c-type cytochrome [Roseibium aestuarii]|uniref:C-type cytochrome n=1 Tax=Roseibium aestuarii TaxID=2600299 RepID=A0ABW4JTS7_9HYPH|nr:c-type cytochrome [Roseibium aestuarii]
MHRVSLSDSRRSTGRFRRSLAAGLIPAALVAVAFATGAGAETARHPDTAVSWPDVLAGHGGPVKSVQMSPDGQRMISTSFDYSARVWTAPAEGASLAEPQVLIGHEAAVNDARFLPGNRAATVSDDSDLIIWDLGSGTPLHRFPGKGEKVLSLEVSDDGAHIGVASWENEARIYDLTGPEPRLEATLSGHRNNVNALAFSPEGDKVWTASTDGAIRRFDRVTAALERQLFSLGWGINTLKRLDDGRSLLFGGADGTVGLIDGESGFDLGRLTPHSRPVLALAVSPDGRRLASGGGDGLIHVHDRATQTLIETFETPYGPVWGLSFDPEGTALYYVGLDDTIHRWQITPRKPFEPLEVTYPRRFQVADADDPGALQFARKCSVCHTLTPDDGNRAGPTLYGVFGRKAGSLPGYPYSDALLKSDIVWSRESISQLFEHGPDVVTPGTKMPIQRMRSPDDRLALVTFLEKATRPTSGGSAASQDTTGDTVK